MSKQVLWLCPANISIKGILLWGWGDTIQLVGGAAPTFQARQVLGDTPLSGQGLNFLHRQAGLSFHTHVSQRREN
jgi:hypothetical protein